MTTESLLSSLSISTCAWAHWLPACCSRLPFSLADKQPTGTGESGAALTNTGKRLPHFPVGQPEQAAAAVFKNRPPVSARSRLFRPVRGEGYKVPLRRPPPPSPRPRSQTRNRSGESPRQPVAQQSGGLRAALTNAAGQSGGAGSRQSRSPNSPHNPRQVAG